MSRHIVKFAIGLLGCMLIATAGAQSGDQSAEAQSGIVTVERLEQATSKARKTAVFILLVIVAVVIGILIWTGRQLSQFINVIRRISDGHIIVPRSEWETRAPVSPSADTTVTEPDASWSND